MNVSTILFIIVAILIVYMLYKKYQGGSDVAPAPNRPSADAPRIEIDETILELNPNSSNEEEGYMTEGYTEFLSPDDQKDLSGNIVLYLGWGNREGFGTVDELRFYRYVDSESPATKDKKSYGDRKKSKTALYLTKMQAFYKNGEVETEVPADKIGYNADGKYAFIKKADDANMFTSFKDGYKIKFGNKNNEGGGAYSVVGRTHMRIEYVIGTTTGHLVPETFEGTDVTDDNLDLTLSMTATETRSITPVYKDIQVSSNIVKESFYVIPGPFETTDDNKKIKIGGRRDLGNIGTSELFPETSVLRIGTNEKSYSDNSYYDKTKNVHVFTNNWYRDPTIYLDGFINDPTFEKRVQAQRGVMFRAAGDTEEFNIVVSKTKFIPSNTLVKDYTCITGACDAYSGSKSRLHILDHKDFEFDEDTGMLPAEKQTSYYVSKYNDSANDYEGRIGLRSFHRKTTKGGNPYKNLESHVEQHWTPANDEGGEFYVKINDDSTLGWTLEKASTNASKFKLFKKGTKKLKISDSEEIDVNIYNIQLVETDVINEDRRFLVTTNHTSSDSERNKNKIYAKKIDATMSQPEYKSIDWAFVNTKDVGIGYDKSDGGVEMIVNETNDKNKDKYNFSYALEN